MNGSYGTTTTTALQVTGSRLIDDLLRRELRVGDPRNALEVVTALRKRYSSDALRLDQEIAGLPIRFEVRPALPAAVPAGETPGSKEERRVLTHLESDLAALIDSRDNREWATEIRGWRETLVRELAEGAAAARLAQDPAMRDRGFLATRKLGEYARVARLVGVMNTPLNCDYRRLASTLDEAANVVRILMGEALFDAGLAEGGFIIQVPVFELRDRRDALMLAVRRLSGTEIDTENDDWGDALAAYRELLAELQRRGASELRVYLRADLLSAVLDGLIGDITRQDPDALRQVAATSPIEIARLTRLYEIANQLLANRARSPITAALALYVRALQLFLDGFAQSRSGSRLIDLSMPLPLAAQQNDEPDREGRRILRELVSLRGEYAREVECFLSCCGCDQNDLRCQVQLDKVLYDIDRAIDLYAQGSGIPPRWGNEEVRASVYGLVARNLAAETGCVTPVVVLDIMVAMARSAIDLMEAVHQLSPQPVMQESVAFLRQAIGVSEASAMSRSTEEGARRALAAAFAAISGQVLQQHATLGVIQARVATIPLGIADAIRVLIDLIEMAVGATGIPAAPAPAVPPGFNVAILGVNRSGGAGGFDVVGRTLAAFATINPVLRAVQNALIDTRIVLRAVMRAVGDPVAANAQANRQQVFNLAANLDGSLQLLRFALNPPRGVLPPNLQLLVSIALDAGLNAQAVASRVTRLPATTEVEPVALGQIVNNLVIALLTALPANRALIDAVFDEQLRSEEDWQILVQSLAPRCLGQGRTDLALAGLDLLHLSPRRTRRIDPEPQIVPHERVSLADLSADVGRVTGLVDATIAGASEAGRKLRDWVTDARGDIGRAALGFTERVGRTDTVRHAAQAARDVAEKFADVADDLIETRKRRIIDWLDEQAEVEYGGEPPVAQQAPRGPAPPFAQTPDQKLPDVAEFAQKLYPYCRARGELEVVIDEQRQQSQPDLKQEWEAIKAAYRETGRELDRDFVECVDDCFDFTKKTPLQTKRVDAVFQKAVYPRPLSK